MSAYSRLGLPLLCEALAWFECQVVSERPAGDHVLVLGKVINGKLLDSQAQPMSYRQPAKWTAPLGCSPKFSAIHDAALGTTASTARVRQWTAYGIRRQ
jgi:flavin reductase (DIM6/NTAB) family NADH-FMN oxidoreductase RutF